MLAIVQTRACVGVSAPAVSVEVHLSGGLPALSIVGLPETGVRESKERVRSALINAGFVSPSILPLPTCPKRVAVLTCQLPLAFWRLLAKFRPRR
jgi:hypothetical protein